MIRFLKGNSPTILVFIFFLGLSFALLPAKGLYISPEPENFFNKLFQFNIKDKYVISLILSSALYLASAFYINNINRKHIIFSERTQMPGFFYILFTGPLLSAHIQLNALLVTFLFINALDVLFTAKRSREKIDKRFFEAGFIVGLIALINYNFVFTAAILVITLLMHSIWGWREWLTSIIGAALPIIFIFWLAYIFNFEVDQSLFSLNQGSMNYDSIPSHYYAHIFINMVLIILASYIMVSSYQSRKVQSRRFLLILLWLFIVSVIFSFGLRFAGLEAILIMGIPVSYQFAHYFNKAKPTRAQNLLLLSYLFLSLFIKIFSHLK